MITRSGGPGGMLLAGFILLSFLLNVSPGLSLESKGPHRWMGHDFVLCFISDDATRCNVGWFEKGLEMDFQFTISINANRLDRAPFLSSYEVEQFVQNGFEVSNHTTSHATYGMTQCEDGLFPPHCDILYRNLHGYYDFSSSFTDSSESMPYFRTEINRQILADYVGGLETETIKTLAYPKHGHSRAIVEELRNWGYLGARTGRSSPYYSDYTTLAENSWDDGISFYRVPIAFSASEVFGDHSAIPPVHFTQEEFIEATMPYIQEMQESGGILAITAHHYGDDDTCHSTTWGYGSGGMTDTDLEWMVDLVRENNGTVMTFSDALEYYKETAVLHEVDGDYVWVYAPDTGISENIPSKPITMKNHPNPFNPSINFNCELLSE